MTNEINNPTIKPVKKMYWLIYLSLIPSGVLLLGSALGSTLLTKWTAKLGVGLLYSAFALIIGNGRQSGFIAVAILWISIIITIFIK
jgi:hypothetical protein